MLRSLGIFKKDPYFMGGAQNTVSAGPDSGMIPAKAWTRKDKKLLLSSLFYALHVLKCHLSASICPQNDLSRSLGAERFVDLVKKWI